MDVAYGGMFYVIADAAELGIDLTATNGSQVTWQASASACLIGIDQRSISKHICSTVHLPCAFQIARVGRMLTQAAEDQIPCTHPDIPGAICTSVFSSFHDVLLFPCYLKQGFKV